MSVRTFRGGFLGLASVVIVAGCSTPSPSSPSLNAQILGTTSASVEMSRPASRCVNVSYEGVAALGFPLGYPGPLGALPGPAMIGDIHGTISSYITSASVSGTNGQGAAHYGLKHTFVSTDASRPGQFETEDRAVCAVAGKDPLVCRVNDVLEVVNGTGVFANANGFLTNHGTIDLNTMSLTIDLGGRVCGDGL